MDQSILNPLTRNTLPALLLMLAGLLAPASSLAAERALTALEEAAEVSALQLQPAATQTVYARICDECKLEALRIDSGTRFFDGRRLIDAAYASDQSGRGATVFFDPATKKVTRVVFWPRRDRNGA